MTSDLVILGINFGGHDTSACLMINGKIVAACEEERFLKEKHTREFPTNSINECLRKAKITMDNVDEIGIDFDPVYRIKENYLKPALNDEKRLEFLFNDIERVQNDYNIEKTVREKTNFKGKFTTHLHHLCHLASCFYPSGFDNAVLFSNDGMGEIETSLYGIGRDDEISIFHKGNRYPNSLGLLYSAITHYLGWKHHSDEGIIMGLASYGDDTHIVKNSNKSYKEFFKEIIYETGDFDFEIDLSWIAYYHVRDKWISDKFLEVFGPQRQPEGSVTQHHKDVAAALQNRIEEIVLNQLKKVKEKFGLKKLCIAGGVGLNCSLNGKIIDSKLFEEIFVQPASGDNGAAIGACFLSHKKLTNEKISKKWNDSYLGSSFTNDEIKKELKEHGLDSKIVDNIYEKTAVALKNKKIIGWFQGGAEFGPRALGNRSILTSPFPKEMKDILNSRVKFREEFRPFAPAILYEFTQEYFDIQQESPHMLITAQVKPEKVDEIPAVVHVDNSARLQTVKSENNDRFRKLIEAFHKITNCPVILNTSFNVKGQPIVNSPKDAIECFLGTNIDVLVIGDYYIEK